jgi:nucleoside phosphorylase
MSINFRAIRTACAKVLRPDSNEPICVAFLISGQYALTSSLVASDNSENVILEFPSGKYNAKITYSNEEIGVAVLFLDKLIGDTLPLVMGVDATFGDISYFYGFPEGLEGSGIFFEGRIQDIASSDERAKKFSIIVYPIHNISVGVLRGFPGSPLIVKNSVVGLCTGVYQGGSQSSDFLVFSKSQDAIGLLPNGVSKRILPSKLSPNPMENLDKARIVVVTALEEELLHLTNLKSYKWSGLENKDDEITYVHGKFNKNTDIIATTPRSPGMVATAIHTSKILQQFRPEIAAMIGICGGRKERGLNIGDIVVADICYQYEFGSYRNGKFNRELRVENVSDQVTGLAKYLSRNPRVLSKIQSSVPLGFKRPKFLLDCKVGPIACADLVVEDPKKMEDAVEADRKTLAVDMESFAFMRAARLANIRWAFVVKSVSDFADANKDDEYREYAKYTSTKFFIEIARSLTSGLKK